MLGGYKGIVERVSSSKMLVLVLGIQTALIIARTLNLYFTGFQTPDEANYILGVITGNPQNTRVFFDVQLGAFFQIFGIDSITRFVFFFPFYLALWTFSFIILAYKTVGLIADNRITRDFVILSLPFAISYSLLSVGLVTETPGLTMCMLGVYSWIRYSKIEQKWYLVAIGAAAFVAAAYSREPYQLFPIAASVAFIGLAAFRRVPIHHAATFVLISLLIAVPNSLFYHAVGGLSSIPTSVQTTTSVVPLPQTTSFVSVVTNTTSYVATVTSSTSTYTTTTMTTHVSTVTSTTATSQVTTQVVQPSMFSSLESVVGNSLYLFFYGLVLGWGPVLFIISAVSFILMFKSKEGERRQWLVIILAILSLGTYYGSTVFLFNDVHFYVTQGFSNLIRLTNTSLPAYILLSTVLVNRMTQARVKVLAVLVILITIGMAGFYVSAVQSNFELPYNVIGIGHVSIQLLARDYLIRNASYDNPTIVFLPYNWLTPQLYLRNIPGLVMYPAGNLTTLVYRSNPAAYRSNPAAYDSNRAVLQSNYTDNYFLMLHPTQFYVLAGGDLASWPLNATGVNLRPNSESWPPNATLRANVDAYFGYAPLFLVKTYGFLFHVDTSSYGATPYTIVSVSAVDSPSGHFLVVHAKWQNP